MIFLLRSKVDLHSIQQQENDGRKEMKAGLVSSIEHSQYIALDRKTPASRPSTKARKKVPFLNASV